MWGWQAETISRVRNLDSRGNGEEIEGDIRDQTARHGGSRKAGHTE